MLEFVKNLGGMVADKVQEHSPEIALGVGIASMIGATVVACKGTIKAKKIIEEAKEDLETVEKTEELGHTYDDNNDEIEYTHEDSLKDKGIIFAHTSIQLAKVYGPAVILTAAGIFCLLSGHHILRKRNFALVAAYNGISEAYKKYQDKVKDIIGEEKARNLKLGLEEREIEADTGKKNKDGSPKKKKEKYLVCGNPVDELSRDARIYDSGCPEWENDPAYNLMILKGKQNHWNDLLRARPSHTVFLNEVYRDLGFRETTEGQGVGWTLNNGNGDGFVDFGIFNLAYQPNVDFVNGYEPVCVLDFNVDGVVLDALGDGNEE